MGRVSERVRGSAGYLGTVSECMSGGAWFVDEGAERVGGDAQCATGIAACVDRVTEYRDADGESEAMMFGGGVIGTS